MRRALAGAEEVLNPIFALSAHMSPTRSHTPLTACFELFVALSPPALTTSLPTLCVQRRLPRQYLYFCTSQGCQGTSKACRPMPGTLLMDVKRGVGGELPSATPS